MELPTATYTPYPTPAPSPPAGPAPATFFDEPFAGPLAAAAARAAASRPASAELTEEEVLQAYKHLDGSPSVCRAQFASEREHGIYCYHRLRRGASE